MFDNLAKELSKLFQDDPFKLRTIVIEVTKEELKKLSKDIAEHFNSQDNMIYSGKKFGIENAQFASVTTPFIKINFKLI